jgi:NADPH-dependent glutamate synthase beta subunit-like oxidoreductase
MGEKARPRGRVSGGPLSTVGAWLGSDPIGLSPLAKSKRASHSSLAHDTERRDGGRQKNTTAMRLPEPAVVSARTSIGMKKE